MVSKNEKFTGNSGRAREERRRGGRKKRERENHFRSGEGIILSTLEASLFGELSTVKVSF